MNHENLIMKTEMCWVLRLMVRGEGETPDWDSTVDWLWSPGGARDCGESGEKYQAQMLDHFPLISDFCNFTNNYF